MKVDKGRDVMKRNVTLHTGVGYDTAPLMDR